MSRADVTIYHNPKCGTSVMVLGLLRERGLEPRVVEYLKTPPALEEWKALIGRSGLGVRPFLRTKEKLYGELDLGNSKWTDAQLVKMLAEHPALLNRPVGRRTRACVLAGRRKRCRSYSTDTCSGLAKSVVIFSGRRQTAVPSRLVK